jgi:hypothetical protein
MKYELKKTFIRIGSQRLNQLGYEYLDRPTIKGRTVFFFRKNLGNDVFSFIDFNQYSFVKMVINGREMPRRFDISLWRNFGEQPRLGYISNQKNMDNWINILLSFLLWSILDIKVYEGPYHIWEYRTQEELIIGLNDAFDKTIEFGIPWLENPNSKHPK